MLFLTLTLVTACSTKNGAGNGSSGGAAAGPNAVLTVCESPTNDPTLCTCSTYAGNSLDPQGSVCVPSCTANIATGAHCCLKPDESASTAIAFCGCGAVKCAANETAVTDCQTASANAAAASGEGTSSIDTCK